MFPQATGATASFPYRIEAKVGEGSMGVVYRAFDPDLGRAVAIKVMRREALEGQSPEERNELRLRFAQEARAAAALAHPGVTTIYRIGEEAGQPYIVMEWLSGDTLEAVLKRTAPLPPGSVARLGADVAEALAAAHEAGIVHRDIKPSNLMVLKDGRLKITDFGIARFQGAELVKTRAGDVLATPMYASPEQLRGEEVDGRSDLFSLGIVLYYALTGKHPFAGRNVAELSASVLFSDPVPPTRHVPTLDAELGDIVLRILAKARERRFESARSLARALRSFADETALAATAPAPLRAGRTASGSASAITAPVATVSDDPFPEVVEAQAATPDRRPAPGTPERTRNQDAHPASGVDAAGTMVATGLPREVTAAVARVASGFESKPLGRTAISSLLSRLLEFPLHAEPYSGALAVGGEALLLLHDGWILGAIDLSSRRSADEIVESLPAEAEAVLHPAPAGASRKLVPLLASLLVPRVARHAELDSSFVNLPALGKKLEEESFDGILTLQRRSDIGFILLDSGKAAMALFSDGWTEAPLERPWETWVSDLVVRASVEEIAHRPVYDSYRRLLRDFDVAVETGASDSRANPSEAPTIKGPATPTGSKRLSTASLFLTATAKKLTLGTKAALGAAGSHRFVAKDLVANASPKPGGPPRRIVAQAFATDGAEAFLRYLLDDLPAVLAQRSRADGLKYITAWIPLIRKARLHHDLPRPAARESDFFDLVTFDAEDKVLHLAHRVAKGTKEALRDFIARVVAAKTARIKTGDVGGALLVAPSFDEEAAEVYRAAITHEGEKKAWAFGAIESATNYEGFVRIGARRGFHLMLIEEESPGYKVLLP